MSFNTNTKFKELIQKWVEGYPIKSGDVVVDAAKLRGKFRWWCYGDFPNSYIVSQKLFSECLKEHLPHRRSSGGLQFFLSDDTANRLKLMGGEDEAS